MRRREVIVFLGTVGLWPFTVHAQQPARMKHVATMIPSTKVEDQRIGSSDPIFTLLFEEMKRLGYVEGVNFVLDRYSAEGHYDRYPEIAHKIVTTRPDVILAISNPVTSALLSETRTIPIAAWTGDPIGFGFATSLARPGGNLTGVSLMVDTNIVGKRLQFLVEAVGKISNFRYLTMLKWDERFTHLAETMAENFKIPTYRQQLLQSPVDETEYRRAFEAMKRDHVDAVEIGPDTENYTNRVLLGRLAREYRIPALCWFSDSVEAGALMSYEHEVKASARRLGAQIVEILNGGNPAEMPIFQETQYELVINLKAAKELGLEIPPGMVAGADRVIE